MESSSLFFAAVIGVIVNALVLYVVISAATRAKQRSLYEWAQLDLLSKIARAHGVPEQEITGTFKAAGLIKDTSN